MKKNYISKAVATCLLASSSVAGTISLNEGWNLVTVPSNVAINKDQIDNLRAVTTYNGMSPVSSRLISTLQVGKGYWVDVNSSTTLNFEDGTIRLPSFQPGWNLVGLPSGNKDEIENSINEAGYKFDSIMTYNGMSPVSSRLITTIDTNKGYWVFLQAIGATTETADGYTVKIYVDSESSDVTSLSNSIRNYTLEELTETSNLDFSEASNIVITTNINGIDVSTPYLNPNDSSFGTSLLNEISTTLDQDYTQTQQTTSGASVYVYGLSNGGAPYIINDVNIYSVNASGERGVLLGTTSATGYIYLSNVSTNPDNPTRIILEKNGFSSSLQTITAVAGGASYLFISEDDGTGVFDFGEDSTTNVSTSRSLHLTDALLYPNSDGYVSLKPGSSTQRNSGLNINSRALRAFPLYEDISSLLQEDGYETSLLGSFFIRGKSAQTNRRYSYGAQFTDIFNFSNENGAGSLQDIREVISVRGMSESLQDKMVQAIEDQNLSSFKSNIEVYALKSIEDSYAWEKLDNGDFDFVALNDGDFLASTAVDDYVGNQNSYINDYANDLDGLIKVKGGTAISGPRALFAVYKEQVVSDELEISYDNYTVNVNVVNEVGQPLQNAAVTMTRRNTGTDVLQPANASGVASFDFAIEPNQNEILTIGVMQGNHYPVTRSYNITSLNPVSNGQSTTNITIALATPPEYATVKGEVTSNEATVSNAKVDLLFPIALSNVQKDVTKIIDDQQRKGLFVSNIPNTRYSWYIKKHTDDLGASATQAAARSLSRVSSDRWILVQKATAAQSGNFLSYNKVVNQVLSRPLDNDPSDVKIIASGQFDVAVQVEHDIDADGSYDFTELAVNDQNRTDNLSGEEFVTSPDNDYGRTIGFISTAIDIEAMYNASGEADLYKDVYEAKINDGSFIQISEDGLLNADDPDTTLDDLKNSGLVSYDLEFTTDELNEIDGLTDNIQDSFKITGDLDYGRLMLSNGANDGELKSAIWDISVTATIALNDSTYKKVKLVPSGNSYSWSENTTDVNDIDTSSLIRVGKYVQNTPFNDRRLRISKISRKISENSMMEKLAMTLPDILSEAGIAGTAASPENILFDDGFTLSVIPTATYETEENNITFRAKGRFDFTNLNLRDYVKIDEVQVQRPVLLEEEQTNYTDRVGMYSFPAVPLAFGNMDNLNSLLRVNAKKLGYYTSPTLNVEKFTQDDTTTVSREDVQRVDIELEGKPTYDVTVNVVDQNDQPLADALVTLDGIMVQSDEFISEFESSSTLQGSSVEFENVIGGRGSNRILKVNVPSDDNNHYLPKVQTIRNLNSDRTITVEVVNTSDVAEHRAVISIVDRTLNQERGSANISARIYDKEDGTLTSGAQIIVYRDGQVLNAPINRNGNLVDISLPLNIGRNEVVIEVLNTAGSSVSNPIIFEYDRPVGSITGNVLSFTDGNSDRLVDDGRLLFMDIYDNQARFLNSIMLPQNGEYMLENLPSSQDMKLQVSEFNTQTGFIVKKSDLVDVTVPVASTMEVDITLEAIEGSIEGSPVFDFTRDIRISDVNDTNGHMNVSMTLSNFDIEYGSVGIFVNDMLQQIPQNQIIFTGSENSYMINNFSVQLRPGTNLVYGIATNPNGEVDYTREQFIDWTPTGESTLTTANIQVYGCDLNVSNNTPINCNILNGLTRLELFDQYGAYVNYLETNSTGAGSFTNLQEGNYTVAVQSSDSNYMYQEIPMPVFGHRIENIGVRLLREPELIEIPEFELMGMDLNATNFEVGSTYTANVNVMTAAQNLDNFTFNWYTSSYNENYELVNHPLQCNGQTCQFTTNVSGWVGINVDVNSSGVVRNASEEVYVQELLPETPPSGPIVPNMPSIPNVY